MRELTSNELQQVSGGATTISGYQASAAILAVLGAGAVAAGPIGLSAVVLGIAIGSAAGMAGAQLIADIEAS